MRVQVEFVGVPFDRAAVLHTLRHLALRMGWTLSERSGERRIIYATTEEPAEHIGGAEDIVILASERVRTHLETSNAPIPLTKRLPFLHPTHKLEKNWVGADVVAGAFAVMNLWYETRTRGTETDGWIRWRDDWWVQAGIEEAYNIADVWLDEIALAAVRVGWLPDVPRFRLANAPFVVVLTHDVDYLPGPRDKGAPRFLRAVARQLMLRRNVKDAMRLVQSYAARWQANPYATLGVIRDEENAREANSSFQVVVDAHHRFDPVYDIARPEIAEELRGLADGGREICLHGSYTASRTRGRLGQEKEKLEAVLGRPVMGHRQHYLNFSPQSLFCEVERAGFAYDMSVGYNDAPGARAGTRFPYRPYAVQERRPFGFWEMPFVVMDTTLATTYRDSAAAALARAKGAFEPMMRQGGCAGLIWHSEQSSGLIDPGYDRVYLELLDWLRGQGGALVNGRALLPELEGQWQNTWSDS